MFIGHFAVALGSKKIAPTLSLGTLVLSAQLVDLLWPLFLLLDIEHARIDPGNTAMTPLDFYDYPFTHSLIGAMGWSLVMGIGYFVFRRELRNALVVGFCVFSHWVLDFITHRPDLPLGFDGMVFFGLGLWNSFAVSLIVELGLFMLWFYLKTTGTKTNFGFYGFWFFIALLIGIHLANVFGPPPPSIEMVAIAGNSLWLLVLMAYWVDKNRMLRKSVRL